MILRLLISCDHAGNAGRRLAEAAARRALLKLRRSKVMFCLPWLFFCTSCRLGMDRNGHSIGHCHLAKRFTVIGAEFVPDLPFGNGQAADREITGDLSDD